MTYRLLSSLLLFGVIAQGQRFGQSQYNSRNTYSNNAVNSYSSGPQDQQSRSNYNCPERNGTFPTKTCDGYVECKDGVAEEKLCPDGLLYNPAGSGFPCQYPIDVDCTGREGTQPAQATEECPHQYGYFPLGDATHCGQFLNCAAGRGFTFDCPEGLAWNADTYRCDWPDQVPACDAEAYLGFTCPPEAKGFFGEEYKYFRSPSDCQRYFVCIEGRPRMYNCGEGRAYNELTLQCDGLENVTGCAPSYNANYDQSGRGFRG